MNYIETFLAFIESKEMRDYLMMELPKSGRLPVLEQIVREIKLESDRNVESPTNRAVEYVCSCHKALAERHSGSNGSVFWLRAFTYNKAGNDFFDNAFFQNFEAAIQSVAIRKAHCLDGWIGHNLADRQLKLMTLICRPGMR